jgi:hypothetical protein
MADLNRQLLDAAEGGDLDAVKLLVAQGADPAYRGAGGENAIIVGQRLQQYLYTQAIIRLMLAITATPPSSGPSVAATMR